MSETKKNANDDANAQADKDSLSYSLLQDMREQLARMETTMYRRLDEVSAEVNATCQMVGMSEDSLKGNFSEVLSVLEAISFSGDGSTAANTGVELDAVVKASEDAATAIMDAADQISAQLDPNAAHWSNEAERAKTLDQMRQHLQDIVVACSFQDITGQRIRKTLENIEEAEQRLSDSLTKLGLKTDEAAKANAQTANGAVPKAAKQETSNQADIDALFD